MIPRSVKIGAGMVLIVAYYVSGLDCPIDPEEYSLPAPPAQEPNTDLRKAKLLARGFVHGPEALAFKDNLIYTGLSDGRIVALDTEWDQVETLMFTGNPQQALPFPCGEYKTEHICGRPLGMQFDAEGSLIVADAYFGLLSVNVTRKKSKSLTTYADGKRREAFRFTNSVAVSQKKKGPIYFTDSSNLPRRDYFLEVLQARPMGRVVKYDPKTKKTETILKGLYFANGLLLSADETYLLVAETTKARIIKFDLTKGKKGKKTVWADNLPILPDNLSWDTNENGEATGAVWVGGTKRAENSFFEWLGGYADLRGLMAITLKPEWVMQLIPKWGATLRLGEDGAILDAPQDSSGRLHSISGAYAHGDSVYLGSYQKDFKFIGKVPRADLNLKA